MLYFFYVAASQETWGFDPDDRGSWRVLYFDAHPDTLVRTDAPPGMDKYGIFTPCAVTFSTELVLPPWDSAHIAKLHLTEEERDSYDSLLGQIADLQSTEDELIHRLLGYPDEIQGDMELECQLVSHGIYCGDPSGYRDPRAAGLEAGATDWRLLLQIDSDDNADMMWGDVGRIYYWIRQEDLQIRDFDSTWMILQCF